MAMPSLPGGIITFLLTDVEGSTRLWEQQPAAMRAALARHDALVATAVTRHRGVLLKSRGEGDSTFSVFSGVADAVNAALALQLALQREPRDGPALRVRVALHTGEADLCDGDYYGPTVNRAARLRALAHGGQVLLSQITVDLARDALPPGADVRALGDYALAGMSRPERVYQLLHPDLPADFPPLKADQASRTNLPQALTSFVGRERELAQVRVALSATRLLTLVGVGGSGKTRLALQLAGDLLSEYPHGVWLVELAALADPALVPGAVAAALGLREDPGQSPTATICAYLRARRALLLLDNCEHLLSACAALAASLLQACAQVQILATSQEALGVAGETIWRVPALALPDAARAVPVAELARYEAVQLFMARAVASRPGFALTEESAPLVLQICRRLDGLPLAIELAAARLAVLPLEQLAQRLDDRFRLLRDGNRAAQPRQQTLRAAMDWSYNLLAPREQAVLRRLSAFSGGWTLEAAEAVCSGGEVQSEDVLDLLLTLVARSLVQLDEQGGQARYRLLETVRQYAQTRLEHAGEAPAVRRKHLEWCLALAQHAATGRYDPRTRAARLSLLEAEHDNLRAALTLCKDEASDHAAGLRLAAALWWFWSARGYLSEGRQWLEAMLAATEVETRGHQIEQHAIVRAEWKATGDDLTAVRAAALAGASTLALRQGDVDLAEHLAEESIALWTALQNDSGLADALACLGEVERQRGSYERALTLYTRSLDLWRGLGDKEGVARALNGLGTVALYQADYARARTLYEESAAIAEERGDMHGRATAANNLGIIAQRQGDYRRAAMLYAETLRLWRELGDRRGVILVLINMGMLACQQGQTGLHEAVMRYRESLTLAYDLGDKWSIALGLEGLAEVATALSLPEQATLLYGAADDLRRAIGITVPAADRQEQERALAWLRGAVGDERFAELWAAGRAMGQEAAMSHADALLQASRQLAAPDRGDVERA